MPSLFIRNLPRPLETYFEPLCPFIRNFSNSGSTLCDPWFDSVRPVIPMISHCSTHDSTLFDSIRHWFTHNFKLSTHVSAIMDPWFDQVSPMNRLWPTLSTPVHPWIDPFDPSFETSLDKWFSTIDQILLEPWFDPCFQPDPKWPMIRHCSTPNLTLFDQ